LRITVRGFELPTGRSPQQSNPSTADVPFGMDTGLDVRFRLRDNQLGLQPDPHGCASRPQLERYRAMRVKGVGPRNCSLSEGGSRGGCTADQARPSTAQGYSPRREVRATASSLSEGTTVSFRILETQDLSPNLRQTAICESHRVGFLWRAAAELVMDVQSYR
jgi:hypothetical protein